MLCVECEHLNPPGKQVCDECEAELFMDCPACGRRNERIYTRCQACRRPLHRSRWSRWLERVMGKGFSLVSAVFVMDILNFARFANVSQAVTERVVPWC